MDLPRNTTLPKIKCTWGVRLCMCVCVLFNVFKEGKEEWKKGR